MLEGSEAGGIWGVGTGRGYQSLHAVTLWPIPLYDELLKVQEEDIPTVETLPGHLPPGEPWGRHRPHSDLVHHPSISSPTPSLPLTLLSFLPLRPGRWMEAQGTALEPWLMPTSPATTFLLPLTWSSRWMS